MVTSLSLPPKRALRKIVLLIDAVMTVVSFMLSFVLQDRLQSVLPFIKNPPDAHMYTAVAIFVIPLWLILTPLFGLQMELERFFSPSKTALRILKHHLTGFVGLAVMLYMTQLAFNRSLIFLFMICSFTSMFTTRLILGWRRRYDWRHGYLRSKVILVGKASPLLSRFIRDLSRTDMPPEIIGIVGDEPAAKTNALSHLGELDALEQLLHTQSADQVIFFPPYHTVERAGDALVACETVGVVARLAIEMGHPGRAVPRVSSMASHPFITFDLLPPRSELLAVKHGFDAVASFLGLLLLSPLFAVVSLLILITMGRPIFFIQERAGKFGRIFRMLKFRTMKPGAEKERDALNDQNEMDGPVFKVTDDPRVTRLGRFLRRSSIDELPQLINVLFGTMSLVGPRPLPIAEQQQIYGWHRRRLSMKPGITGIWQTSGRSDIDFHQWMRLDLDYIDNWSLMLDLKLLLGTVKVVLTGKGAR